MKGKEKKKEKVISKAVKDPAQNPVKRLSDEEFFTVLRENGGLFSRTARAIQQKYGIKYSRQAVKDRADKHPEILEDIHEENLDIAEEHLHAIMRGGNPSTRLKAIELYLKHKGRHRGYRSEQMEIKAKAEVEKTEEMDQVPAVSLTIKVAEY